MPALDPSSRLFRAKSPQPVSSAESSAGVRSPSPSKVRAPVKVAQRFKSPEPPSKQLKSPEPQQAALSPEPVMNREREQNGLMGKSVINGTDTNNIKLPGTSTHQIDTTDDQSLTRKKVVKVVRRVVRKVLPTEEDEVSTHQSEAAKPVAEPVGAVPAQASVSKPPVMSGFSFKHDVIKTEDKDDFSRGLTHLMVRGRTREPRPRLCKNERPENIDSEKKSEKKEEKVELKETKEEKEGDKSPLNLQEVNHKAISSGPVIQEVKSPAVAVNPGSMTSERSAPTSSKLTHSRPLSLPPLVGFIPAPRPSPLSPPPGFIPAPKTVSVTKPNQTNLPSTASVAHKPFSPSPPSCFIPAHKPSPLLTPESLQPPLASPGLVSPPPGIIPIQRPGVSKQEVECPHLACLVTFETLVWKVHGRLKCMFEKKEYCGACFQTTHIHNLSLFNCLTFWCLLFCQWGFILADCKTSIVLFVLY